MRKFRLGIYAFSYVTSGLNFFLTIRSLFFGKEDFFC